MLMLVAVGISLTLQLHLQTHFVSKFATLFGSNIMLLLICNCSFFSFLGGMQTLASKHKVWIHSKADSGNILTY